MKLRPAAEQALRWLCLALPWAVLGYGVRFPLFGIPTTGLELYLLGLFTVFSVARGWSAWVRAWKVLPARWLLLAWVLIGAAAVLWTPVFWKAFHLWRPYFLEPVLALMLVNVVLTQKKDRDDLRTSAWTVVIFVSVWAIVEFVTGKGIPHPWNVPIADGRRATGPYGYPNAVALFTAPLVAYAGARAWLLRERLAGAAAIVGLLGILVVRSDGGMLAVLVAWALAMLFSRWGRRLLLAGVIAGVMGAFLFPELAQSAWKGLTFQGWSGIVRLYIWRETWDMLRTHWFLGAGFQGYPVVFDAFHRARAIEIFQYPHQFVLSAWSEVGLPGLLLFLGLLGTWARRAWASSRAWASRAIGFAPLIAVVVHGLVDVPYWKNDLAVMFFLLWWMVAWVDAGSAHASEPSR